MHDIAFIRQNPEAFDAAMAKRGAEAQSARVLELDARRRELLTQIQQAQSRRNEASKAIGQAMAQGDKDKAEALKAEVVEAKARMPEWEEEERKAGDELEALLAALPNIPAADVPEGEDESANVEIATWGEPRSFDFTPKEHADLGPALGMDFETGAAISGARFTFLRGQMARLHRALGQFMLDMQTREAGYTECSPPLLVRDDALFGTGQLPKFEDDQFQTSVRTAGVNVLYEAARQLANERGQSEGGFTFRTDDEDAFERLFELAAADRRRWLIPTAEVSLTNAVRDQILDDTMLPIRMTALTPCFRSEAGAAGKDTRGFIRQHQFEKVELVSVTRPEDSEAEHERMTAAAEAILQALNLPYRKMLLCAGDMGFTAKKTYDLEVWLPGQGAFREISSCSNCGDFQARRMDARYRPANETGGEKKTAFVHTLNGSGLAVGRALVAVLENYQNEDGSVTVPEALAPYMGGLAVLTPV